MNGHCIDLEEEEEGGGEEGGGEHEEEEYDDAEKWRINVTTVPVPLCLHTCSCRLSLLEAEDNTNTLSHSWIRQQVDNN